MLAAPTWWPLQLAKAELGCSLLIRIWCCAGWELSPSDIDICTRSDGSKWLLGEGRYGKVYKGVARGVQVGLA